MKNVLVLGGDPPELGDRPRTKPVYGLGAVGLVQTMERLNRGKNPPAALEGAPGLTAGIAVNPKTPDLAAEAKRFWAKVEAGARFAKA